jgi:hypothetical protein
LASTSDVSIDIFDRTGSVVSRLRDDGKAAGSHLQTVWDSSSFAPGTYYAVVHIKSTSGDERTYRDKVYIRR